jgi:peptide/nickel transport system permease protein
MKLLRYLPRLLNAIGLLIGVTGISFLLIVYFGPDPSFLLGGRHLTPERISEIRQQLGLDQAFWLRYLDYLRQLLTFDLGHSYSTGEAVSEMLRRSLPVSIGLTLPGFVIGNLLGLGFAVSAAVRRGRGLDRQIMMLSSVGMSISFVVVVVGLQVLLCTPYGLNLFPVRGWAVIDLSSYLYHVTVPTLVLILVSLGYNTRFYRAILVEELGRDHVLAQRALGLPLGRVLISSVLPNAMIPIITRLLFSVPMLVVGGSLLIESQFGIPGIGKITFDAITSGDQMVLKAVIGLTALLFAMVTLVADSLYRLIDPRLRSA